MIKSLIARRGVSLMAVLMLAALMSTPARATTFSDLATGANTQLTSFGTLLVSGAFLLGIGLVCFGLWTFKVAHKSEGRDAKFSHGMVQLLVGAGLLALPSIAGVSVSSLFSNGTGSAPTQQSINVQ